MPWQKITNYINDSRVQVESKSGNTYPAEVEYDYMAEGIYSQLMNDAHDGKEFWAWVSFNNGTAYLEDWTRKPEGEGPPEKPPWEMGE